MNVPVNHDLNRHFSSKQEKLDIVEDYSQFLLFCIRQNNK